LGFHFMTNATPSIADKRRAFRALHASGCFVIPNPWDVGSARYLETLGFKALATTSAGLAWSLGRADNHVTREQVLTHLTAMAAATQVPLNADFENGFAHEPAEVAHNVALACATGIAGLSIEDATGNTAAPLYSLDAAQARIRAARSAIDAADGGVLLVARAECFLVGRPDLTETIARLRAYADAGADCLYAPGLRTREQIGAVVDAVAPKPVNVLASMAPGLTLADFAALGVHRVSVGGSLARAAWAGLVVAAERIAHDGCFDKFGAPETQRDLNRLFER
jgi:2-methylisocitrate lyase-like PEP mutase family enzyme